MQIARALLAAIAAIMITFSGDHSAAVGLSVFSGFAMATALVLLLSAWIVSPKGERWFPVVLGAIALVAGLVGSVAGWRTTEVYFGLVIVWAAVSGLWELIVGIVGRRTRALWRDEVLIGAITVALAVALLFVSPSYAAEYTIKETGDTGVLTGITIGVGLFGGYAAIIAVFLGIAAFSPRSGHRTTAEVAAEDAR